MAESAGQPTAAQQAATGIRALGRDRIARLVLVGSFLTLFALIAAVLYGAESDSEEAAENIFNLVLPVLSGWVGTVLAFYFSAASQERTSESLDKVLDQAAAGPGHSTPISEKMLPMASIRHVQVLSDQNGPDKISLTDLDDIFDPDKKKDSATRILFLQDGLFKYILHVGTFNTFYRKHGAGSPTLADMLKDESTLRQISKLVAFVPVTATLAEAKAALDSVSGAQDIIVTTSGSSSEPMLGWLSNVDLTKALTAK